MTHGFGAFARRDGQALHLIPEAALLGGDVGGGAGGARADVVGRLVDAARQRA